MSDVRRCGVSRRGAALALLLALCALFLSGTCHDGFAAGPAAVVHHDHHCAPADPHVAAAQPA
ncbi:hypothetical protein, partial [Streptomyces longispororuber]|uniref:hypothetical protein n=1 Tax=Streptomyces longispororuber TaxID=68230 RepID=UPI00210EEEB0